MKLAGLSPEAHGTLRALRNLGHLRAYEENAAEELVRSGYAEIMKYRGLPTLRITDAGASAPVQTLQS